MTEIRHAARALYSSRGSTVAAVLILAVGIGANTAIFSMTDAILYRTFPFPDLDRIVSVSETAPQIAAERRAVAPANYFDWIDQNHVFSEAAAYQPWEATLTGAGDPQEVSAYKVSPGFFPLLGIRPVEGRVLSGMDADNGRLPVVVSYGFWRDRLGGDVNVLGRSLVLNELSYTVIGLMPREFDYPMYADLWVCWTPTLDQKNERVKRLLDIVARLKPGVSLAEARTEMTAIGARLAREYPDANGGRGVAVTLLRDSAGRYTRAFTAVVTSAVVFLLLLACANVANLEMARGAARRKEMAVRSALGASRARILRQLFVEGLLLSLLGASLGLPLAGWGLTLIKTHVPELVARNLRGLKSAEVDSHMLAFACAAAIVTGIAFTLPAAFQVEGGRLHEALNETSRGTSARSGRRVQSALVVSELVFAILLLVGAGLMVEGFRTLAALRQGFDARNVLTFSVSLPESKYSQEHQLRDFYQETLRRLGDVPLFQSVALTSELPALGFSRTASITLEGQPAASVDPSLLVEMRITSEDYFRTLTIPVAEGRGFTRYDSAAALPVAVVSKAAVRRFWPGGGALSRRLKLTLAGSATPWLTVVGVVGDVNHFFLDDEVRPIVYVPYVQQPVRQLNVLIRTAVPGDQTARAVRDAMRSVDPSQPVYRLESLTAAFADLAGGVGVIAAVMTILALIALALASAGIYAVMAYSVVRRTQEIGIRVALGAQRQDILRLIVGHALRLVAVALAIGLMAASMLGRIMSSVLFGVVALDPLQLAVFAVVLVAVAVVASYLPARRAAGMHPLVALRHD